MPSPASLMARPATLALWLFAPSAAARHLAAVWTALIWLRLALGAACADLTIRRRRCGAMVCLYTNSVGGYHSDLRLAWHALHRTVATAAPDVDWSRLQRFTIFFDDQINYPAECCRASLGFVVAGTDGASPAPDGQDPEAVAAAWARHPLVSCHGLRVAVFPAGDCLAADLPCQGAPSYLICLLRALHALRQHVRATGLHTKVPGLLQLLSPAQRRASFLLPLEGRATLLPFARA